VRIRQRRHAHGEAGLGLGLENDGEGAAVIHRDVPFHKRMGAITVRERDDLSMKARDHAATIVTRRAETRVASGARSRRQAR